MARDRFDIDVLVVGARCAGAATAMLLARAGLSVRVVDWAPAATDTMSTHALMRGGVMQLARWGVLDRIRASGTPDITKTTFHYGSETVPVDIRPAYGTPGVIAPRRVVLDAVLQEAAAEAGADMQFGTSFRDVIRDASGRVIGAELQDMHGNTQLIRTRLVIGADGRRSTVARRVGSLKTWVAAETTSCIYAYFDGLPQDGYHWFYAPRRMAGAIPTNDGAHCVFAGVAPEPLAAALAEDSAERALKRFVADSNAAFAEELEGARAISQPVVFRGAPGFLRTSAGRGWALVGDAGYFKDPATAHGITDALRDAEILARAVIQGGDAALRDYEATRNTLSEDVFAITNRIATLNWTMDALQTQHVMLNKAMKVEQAWMEEAFAQPIPPVRVAESGLAG